MPFIDISTFDKKRGIVSALRNNRYSWWQHWRELSDMYLPRRYIHLTTPNERKRPRRNSKILDSTGTNAARILSSGMMNGITSPSRRWFKLRLGGFGEDEPQEMRIWLDQVELRLLKVMAESNFYNALAVMYQDLVIFGSAAMLIYEDFESVIRCYNPALGEYYFAQSSRQQVNTFAREFAYSVHQIVEEWGIENVSRSVADAWRAGGTRRHHEHKIIHLIEPNVGNEKIVPSNFQYRELYWEEGAPEEGKVLAARGFNELPGLFARWEVSGNEPYGNGPGMDALGDVIQLQHETKAKGQSLDKMNDPPVQADASLQYTPTSLLPRGITYVSGLIGGGNAIRPIYQVNPPLAEMTQDLAQLQSRIREVFHNDLFLMISQLDTVRSALEIDARKEEKLVLLGPVLERFENEALDPAINRIFSIAARANLLPPVPEGFEEVDIEVQYQSILAAAQRAVGTASTERVLEVIGAASAIYPKAKNVLKADVLLHDYARDIGVPASGINTLDEIADIDAAEDAAAQAAEEAAIAQQLAEGARTLSDADVGGGVNALEVISGNAV